MVNINKRNHSTHSVFLIVAAVVALFFIVLFLKSPDNSGITGFAVYNSTSGSTIYECGNITQAGIYTLNQSFGMTGGKSCVVYSDDNIEACLCIQTHNVTINGNGFSINSSSSLGYGVYALNVRNFSISNITLSSFTTGIVFDGVNKSLINKVLINTSVISTAISIFAFSGNNTISDNRIVGKVPASENINNGDNGIYLSQASQNNIINNSIFNTNYGIELGTNSDRNTIKNNYLSSNVEGIYLTGASNYNSILWNFMTNGTTPGEVSYGAHIDSCAYNSLGNNTIENNIFGFGLSAISNSTFHNNTIFNISLDSYYLTSGPTEANNFVGGSINTSGYHAISLNLHGNYNNFTNITIGAGVHSARYPSYVDLYINSNTNYTQFTDIFLGKYQFVHLTGGKLIFKNSIFGMIEFYSNISGSGGNLSYDIKIGNNSAFVNSTQQGLNVSANVTLYGIDTSLSNPTILYNDLAACTTCSNFTSLAAGTVKFNVTFWSNYSIGGNGSIDTTIPIVTILQPKAIEYVVEKIPVNFTLNEPGVCAFSVNNGVTNYTLPPNSTNTGFASNTTVLSNDNYVLKAFCNDMAGNKNYTQNISFSINVPSSGGGGGGGGEGGGGSQVVSTIPTGPAPVIITDQQFEQGLTQVMPVNSQVVFSVSGESHSLKVKAFDGKKVTVEIRSNPLTVGLDLGETKKFDLNEDNSYDLQVRFKGVKNGDPEIEILKINEKLPEKVEANETSPLGGGSYVELPNATTPPTANYLVLAVIIILTIAIIIVIVLIVTRLRAIKRERTISHYQQNVDVK